MSPSLPGVQQVLVSHLIGGAGRIAIDLAADARARGARCSAWVPGPGPAADALRAAGVPWRPYSLDELKSGGRRQASALARMGAGLLGGATVLHVHNPTVYGMLSPLLRWLPHRPVVHFHIDTSEDEVAWALRHPPAAVLACSRHIAAEVRRFAGDVPYPVVANQNPVDLDRFGASDRRSARQRVGAPAGRVLLLMLANLAEHKGQLTAIAASRALLDRGVDVECWLAGEVRGTSDFRARLQQAIAALGLEERVRLLGFRGDGPELLRAADYFLLPSTHEGLPLSVLEAQASSCVVLAAPTPGVAEVVRHGETGFLVAHDDAAGYAAHIARLHGDPEEYARVAAAAAAYVRAHHSWRRYVDDTWAVYRAVAP